MISTYWYYDPKDDDIVIPTRPRHGHMNGMRMDNILCDMKLKINNKCYDVHRVMAATVPKLESYMEQQLTNTNNIVEITDLKLEDDVVENLLEFIYTGVTEVNGNNCMKLLQTGQDLFLSDLMDVCQRFIGGSLTQENVMEYYYYSIDGELHIIREKCLFFMSKNCKMLHSTDVLMQHDYYELRELIQQLKRCLNKIEFDEEDGEARRKEYNEYFYRNIFYSIVRWVENNKEKRYDYLDELLKLLPFESMSPRFLSERVEKHELIQNLLETESSLAKTFEKIKRLIVPFPVRDGSLPGLFCIGSYDDYSKSSLMIYDRRAMKWRVMPTPSTKRSYFGADSHQNLVYVAGSLNPFISFDTIEMFNTADRSWFRFSPMPHKRSACAVAVYEENIYVAGGEDEDGERLSTVLRYSRSTREWKSVKPMNYARSGLQLTSMGEYLYALGGKTTAVERYSAKDDQWTTICDMHSSHTHFGSSVFGHKLFVYGPLGMEIYSPDEDRWIATNNSPLVDRGPTLLTLDFRIYVVARRLVTETNFLSVDNVYEYYPEADYWNLSH